MDLRIETKVDDNGYYCKALQLHLTNTQRGLKIELNRKIQDSKTRKFKDTQITNIAYQIFLVDSGKEIPNIHNRSYEKKINKFYYHITNTYQKNLSTLGPRASEFTFKFGRCNFIAKLIELF